MYGRSCVFPKITYFANFELFNKTSDNHFFNLCVNTNFYIKPSFFLSFFNLLDGFNKFDSSVFAYLNNYVSVPSLVDWEYFYTPGGYSDNYSRKSLSKGGNHYIFDIESLNAEYFNVEDYMQFSM